LRRVRHRRKQKTALALDGRIGRRHERHPSQRHAEELDARVFEIEHLLGLIVNDPRRLDLPQRRLCRIVLARLAGGIDAVLQHRGIARRAIGALRGKARVVGGLETERIDEAVTVVVGEIDDLAVGDLAVGLGQPDVALREQALGLLIVGDLVGLDGRAVVIDLHIADRRHAVVGVVVFDLGGLNQHRPVGRDRRRLRLRRPQLEVKRVGHALCGSALGCKRACDEREQRSNERRAQSGANANAGTNRAERTRHYPSSWNNNTTKPVRPPTRTGVHAATSGEISSDLLMSSVILDSTNRRNPAETPLNTIFCTPPKRKKRKLTEAASNTMAASMNGRAINW
jgi:hypothetical protein